METVREMKMWLFHKFQSIGGSNSQSEALPIRGGMGALTPQTVPEFIIPGSNDSSRRTSECSEQNDSSLRSVPKRNSYGGRSNTSSPPGCPGRLSPSESAPCMRMLKRHDLCNSAPVTPRHEMRELLGCRDAHSTSLLDNETDGTNDDPLSFAAMGLPHFRVQTSFGFSTLSEKPHTRRKESLFHVGGEGLLPKKHCLKLAKQDSINNKHSSPDITLLTCSKMMNGKHPSSRSMPSVIVTSFSQSIRSRTPSPETCPSTCLSNRRLSPTYQAFQNLNKIPLPSRHNRFYYRRRSSLVNIKDSDSDLSSVSGQSTPSQNSIDLTNEPQRHSLGDLAVPTPTNTTLKRHSAPHIPSESQKMEPLQETPKPRSSSCHVISKNKPVAHNTLFAPYGELKFSFQYLAASTQLKVTLIKAENLGGQAKKEQNMNPFVKACLLPGKLQKQTSTVLKRTKNPIFNQEMYFQNINLEELHTMTLKIKMFSKGNNLKLQEFIGEVTIPLDGYDVLVDNRIWKDLESRKEREDLGYVGIGLQYDEDDGNVSVMVDQARMLPGTPDPYVRVEILQSSNPIAKKQTSTKKKTSNPVYEEKFKFSVSTKPDDLNATSITITVFDHETIRSDDVIGQVVLGCTATEVTQYGHWQETIENPGNMLVRWHYLVDNDD